MRPLIRLQRGRARRRSPSSCRPPCIATSSPMPKSSRAKTDRRSSRRNSSRRCWRGSCRRIAPLYAHGEKATTQADRAAMARVQRRDRCTSFFRSQRQSRRIHRHGARHDGSLTWQSCAEESFRAVDPYGRLHRGRWIFNSGEAIAIQRTAIFTRVMLAENRAGVARQGAC